MHFASWMFLVGFPYGTIRTYIASIPALYICIGVELSLAKTFYPALARCLKGIRRICPSVPTGKSEITLAILFSIRRNTDLHVPKKLALWSALCVGFFSFLRSGNLVPKLKNAWKPGVCLARCDVHFVEWGAILRLRFSKTHQFEGPPLEVPIPIIPGSALCPTSALRALLEVVDAEPSEPLFSWTRGTWVTYSDYLKYIKSSVKKLGLDPKLYGCHSPRRGGASEAARAGASGHHIKLQGMWASDAYLGYLSLSEEDRWKTPLLLANAAQVGPLDL